MISQKEENRKRNAKMVFGFVALFAAVAIIIGVGFAYFSDIITGSGTATAGTLDITGTVSLTQNGEAVTGTDIANLNPGDVIGIDASGISNVGTKSAWIRDVLQFTSISSTANENAANDTTGDLSKYLYVCSTTTDQATLIQASNGTGGFAANKPADCILADTTTLFGAKDTYEKPGDVISGSAEADGAATTWTPTSQPVIYFDAGATNDAQLGTVAFNVLIQALQYRNNTTSPTETQWSTVTKTSFAI